MEDWQIEEVKNSNLNVKNFKKVLDQIKAHPEQWRQSVWHCGTQHCFAGWAQLLSGNQDDGCVVRTYETANQFLNIGKSCSLDHYLYNCERTLRDFEQVLEIKLAQRKPRKNTAKQTETEVTIARQTEEHVHLTR